MKIYELRESPNGDTEIWIQGNFRVSFGSKCPKDIIQHRLVAEALIVGGENKVKELRNLLGISK